MALEFDYDILFPLNNALNEVCHGISRTSFSLAISDNITEYKELFGKIRKIKCKQLSFSFDHRELRRLEDLGHFLNDYFDKEEFAIRIGINSSSFDELLGILRTHHDV